MRPPTDLQPLIESLRRPSTLRELAQLYGVDRRTIFRWFGILADKGMVVERVGIGRPTRYRLG